MSDNSRRRQRDVGDGDYHVGVADVVFSAAVRDIVDPLVLIFQIDEPLMLARIPIVASRVLVVLATV